MEVEGQRRYAPWAKLVAVAIVLGALVMIILWWQRASAYPGTDDATIDADVVHVASSVSGRIVRIAVRENQAVRKGDLLFQIDPAPYQSGVAQAEAELKLARASLDTQQRQVATQRSAAAVAAEQVSRSAANRALAARTVVRLRPLAAKGYVPRQQLDQAEVALYNADTSLREAREQQLAATTAVGNVAGSSAAIEAREAALQLARRSLANTTVRAPQNGRIVGLSVAAGEVVAPSQSLFTLVTSDSWFATGNFRETELARIRIGQCATVYSMIDRSRPIVAAVDGIGSGVLSTDSLNVPRAVPYVQRSMNWVRVAQRFPVRLRLNDPPPALVRLGASAVIEIGHGRACR